MEKWKPIKDYEGFYEVSNKGNVRSLDREFINSLGRRVVFKGTTLSPRYVNNYLAVVLNKQGTKTTKKIHRLVAETFLDNPNNLPCVNHKDEIKCNNEESNLEWCTHSYNQNYGTCRERIAKKRSKPIFGVNRSSGFILELESTAKAIRLGFTDVTAVLGGRSKSTKNYIFMYQSGILPLFLYYLTKN